MAEQHRDYPSAEAGAIHDLDAIAGVSGQLALRGEAENSFEELATGLTDYVARSSAETSDGVVALSAQQLHTLVQSNAATAILNLHNYGRIFGEDGASFKPKRYTDIDMARVMTADGPRVLIIDGFHRATGCDYFFDAISKREPSFRFTGRDITSDYSGDSLVELEDGQAVLTMKAYLREVLPPTLAQVDIAPERIAALLINGWEGLVGRELAEEFSAMAAYGAFDDSKVNIKSRASVEEMLKRRTNFFDGNTEDDRMAIRQGLREMAEIMAESGLSAKDLTKRAFTLIGSRADSIGGPEGARQQMLGLFGHPTIIEKIAKAYPDDSEGITTALGELHEFTETFFNRSNFYVHLNAIYQAMVRPDIPFDMALEVMNAKHPNKAYEDVLAKVQLVAMEEAYRTVTGVTELTIAEQRLVRAHRKMVESSPATRQQVILELRDLANVLETATEAALRTQALYQRTRPDEAAFVAREIEQRSMRVYDARTIFDARNATVQLEDFLKICDTLMSLERPSVGYGNIVPQPAPEPTAPASLKVQPPLPPPANPAEHFTFPVIQKQELTAGMTNEQRISRAFSLILRVLAAEPELHFSADDKDRWREIKELLDPILGED